MRRRSEWFQITLGLVMILLVTGMQVAGAYEYEETPDEYEFATPEVITSTRWEDATASADADVEEATCSCGVHTWSRVYEDDFAEASAYAYGLHSTDWVWNGPPGTAPGGSLAWTHDGQGGAAIEAGREGSGGSTHAAASAWSLTGADAPGGLSEFFGIAEGSVDDTDLASVSRDYDVTEGASFDWDPYPKPPGGAGYGWFEVFIDWEVYDFDDSDTIAPGTAQFSFSGAAICDSYSEADAAGDPNAFSSTYAAALVRTGADFTSN